jgi:hypothetical protein
MLADDAHLINIADLHLKIKVVQVFLDVTSISIHPKGMEDLLII